MPGTMIGSSVSARKAQTLPSGSSQSSEGERGVLPGDLQTGEALDHMQSTWRQGAR